MTVPLDERAAPALLHGFLAPAAELLAAAIQPSATMPTALVAHWSGVLLAAFQQQHPEGQYVLLECLPPPVLTHLDSMAMRLYGRSLPLPLRPGLLGAVAHGLSFSDSSSDTTLLRETARSLSTGGVYAGAFLMRGSFDAFFDTAREICEAEGFGDALGALKDAENQFRAPESMRALASRAGFVDVEVTLEERGLPFDNARAFLTDPGVSNVLLRIINVGSDSTRSKVFKHVTQALDTYFSGMHFSARVVTGVLRGVKA